MTDSSRSAWGLRMIALGYLALLLLAPLGLIFFKTFEDGIGAADRRDHLARRHARTQADAC